MRGSNGEWLLAFSAHLGLCSNMAAELHAIRIGLMLAWEESFRDLVCEVDALMSIQLIEHADTRFHTFGSLLEDIRMLRDRSWNCSPLPRA